MGRRDIIGIASLLIAFLVVGGGVYLMYSNWKANLVDPGSVAEEALATARKAANAGDFYGALEFLNDALNSDPDLVDANRLRGEVLLMVQDPNGAARDLTVAIDHGHDDAVTRLLRAKALRELERTDAALAEYARVAEMDPANREVWRETGNLLLMAGQFEEAVEHLKRQLNLVPADDRAWRNLAWAYWGQGRYDEALKPFERAAEEDPFNHHGAYGHAVTNILRRDFDAAIADLEQVVSAPEFNVTYPHFHLYLTRLRTGAEEEGRDCLVAYQRQYIEPRHGGDWSGALARFLLGDETEEDLLEWVAETGDPPDPNRATEGLYYAGMRRLLAGDRAGAVEMLQRCAELKVYQYYEYYAAVAELSNIEFPESSTETNPDESN